MATRSNTPASLKRWDKSGYAIALTGSKLQRGPQSPSEAKTQLKEYGESKNLFFLSAPTRYTGLLCDAVTLEEVERMINAASLVFDILVVDGAAEVTNPVSGVGLWLADKIFTLHRPSIAAQMWHRGVADFVRELNLAEKQTHILLAPNGDFDDRTYRSMIDVPFAYELPYIKRAGELENAGTPLYFYRDRPCRRYGKILEEIANRICGGEKP